MKRITWLAAMMAVLVGTSVYAHVTVSPQQSKAGATKTANRITMVTWEIEIPADKYVELPFTAKNPDAAKDVVWNVRQHLAGGSVIDWSDKPGAKEKPSVTKITAVASATPAGD